MALSTSPWAGSAATSAAAAAAAAAAAGVATATAASTAAATAAAADGAAPARPKAVANRCPAATAAVTEAFIAADCTACWGAPAGPAPAQPAAPRHANAAAWRLDWITPAGTGADMATAALPEAAERQARVAASATAASATTAMATTMATTTTTATATLPTAPLGSAAPAAKAHPAPRGWVIEAQSGPAWHQYLGLQFGLRPKAGAAALPAGSSGWLALVEEVPAGTEGTAQTRWLVRAVAGPLPLAARRATTHLQAFRLPDSSRADRLVARAWVESAEGRILWMASDRCL